MWLSTPSYLSALYSCETLCGQHTEMHASQMFLKCSCFLNAEKIYSWQCLINFLSGTSWTSAMWFYSDEPGIQDHAVNVDIKFLLNLFYIVIKGKMKCFAVLILQSFWVYSATYWKEKLIWTPLLKMVKFFCFLQIIINCELGLTQNYNNFIWVSDALERCKKLENSHGSAALQCK